VVAFAMRYGNLSRRLISVTVLRVACLPASQMSAPTNPGDLPSYASLSPVCGLGDPADPNPAHIACFEVAGATTASWWRIALPTSTPLGANRHR
jgi:hypothetical protein